MRSGLLAFIVFTLGDPAFVGTPQGGAGDGPSYLLEERCEGTGTPSGWSDSGTVDWDYATTVLEGSQSWSAAATSGISTYDLPSALSEVWVRFRFQYPGTKGSSSFRVFRLDTTGGTEVAGFRATTAMQAYADGSAGTTFAYDAGTTYYVWIHWTASTSTTDVYVSTTSTIPGSPSCSATGSSGTSPQRVRIAGNNQITVIDEILILTDPTSPP